MSPETNTSFLSEGNAAPTVEQSLQDYPPAVGELAPRKSDASRAGVLIINADDWGRDQVTTQRTLDCVRRQTVSSVSAMVFMDDSERAAAIARESKVDAGLHLNFTTPFSAPDCPSGLKERQREIASYLLRNKAAKTIFHPGLARSFEYVLSAQAEEFQRIYGASAERVDGHHHMHLCANVLFGGLLPAGTAARRNFSFRPGEKSLANRWYRRVIDWRLAKHHRVTDFFFSLPPLEPAERLQHIFSLACESIVELETHPVNPEEYRFLMGDEIFSAVRDIPIACRSPWKRVGRSASKCHDRKPVGVD